MGVGAWMNRVKRRLSRRKLYVFHSADYRLPLSSIESMAGLEPRRADYALWYLLDQRAIRPEYVSTPTPVRFSALERAHSRAYLESLDRPEVLGRILGVDPSDVPVAEVQRTMRLATARDEIVPLQDFRVQSNRAYLVVILLSRVITKLGTLNAIGPNVIEGLFSADLAYLQEFYRKINEEGTSLVKTSCPACGHNYEVDMGFALGES